MDIAIVNADVLARNWWVVLLRGAVSILFGLLTIFAPGISLAALVLTFGAYALVDGVLAVVTAVRRRADTKLWVLLLLEGVVGVAAGVMTLVWPGITALALLYLIAAWSLVTGAFEITAAIRLRTALTGEWLLALSGILSIALGVLLAFFPGPGALALVLWIGIYANIFGALLIVLAFRLRSWARASAPPPAFTQTSPAPLERASHG